MEFCMKVNFHASYTCEIACCQAQQVFFFVIAGHDSVWLNESTKLYCMLWKPTYVGLIYKAKN